MHELAITQSILAIALDEAKKHDAARILTITIRRGILSGVMPEYIQEYFHIISRGTAAEHAKLIIEPAPAAARCNTCGKQSVLSGFSCRCPLCGGTDLTLLSGTEFYVRELEAE